ncbi:putative aMP-binding synthetase [Mycobacterium xenopi 4042]|uniref:Putative aMP-binding synthetase n=1 Tax=Mycobacterium xenopi 4042 TaxID=1299334 RepID=X8BG12_MYCXE|nr:putative aMP-binding synthetase [Mycobacterium xenopi 4042]
MGQHKPKRHGRLAAYRRPRPPRSRRLHLSRRPVDRHNQPRGEKFGPTEVEDAIRTHPAVSDVAVAGIADDEMGQRSRPPWWRACR